MTTREKYLANIDNVLSNVLREKSQDLADKNAIKYSAELEEAGHIKKVAFDVYRVDNDPYQHLWILEDVNGVPHLVRAADPQYNSKEAGEWAAISDYDKANVTLAYKDTPVARFSSNDFGFSSDDIITFKSALLDRISGDDSFVKELLLEQPEGKRSALVHKFPELRKLV